MFIDGVEFFNFRNLRDTQVDFLPNTNIICGNNAQGKTNILEGIYLCSVGKSFRALSDKELVMFEGDYGIVKVRFDIDGNKYTIEIVIKKDGSKIVKINGVLKDKLSSLLGVLQCILFTPEDLLLIKEGPGLKRKYINLIISKTKPIYLKNAMQYNKILMQKREMFKQKDIDIILFETFLEKQSQLGIEIVQQRETYLKELEKYAQQIYFDITKGKEKLEIEYIPSIKQDMFDVLIKNKEKEIREQANLFGPHRDAIEFYINGKNARFYASQGQQRSVALALKLAECQLVCDKTGHMPILLLDDVLSELDESRREYLIKNIDKNQVIITCTELDMLKNNNSKIIKVKNGEIKTEED